MNKLFNNNLINNIVKFNNKNSINKIIFNNNNYSYNICSSIINNSNNNYNEFIRSYGKNNIDQVEKEKERVREFVKDGGMYGKDKTAKPKKAVNRKTKRDLQFQHNRNPDNIIKGGIVSPKLLVPSHIKLPPYALGEEVRDMELYDEIEINTPQDIEGIRAACKLAKEILHFAGSLVQAGITTDQIDRIVHEEIIKRGAYPSPLGYKGFPKSICTSINEILCHGIPDDRPLQNGDIINIDITVYLNGYHGDTSATFPVGEIDEAAKKLIEVAQKALFVGIDAIKPGEKFQEIGKAIQTMTHKHSFGLPPEFTGHGIGKTFHCAPYVFQCVNRFEYVMKPGMIFTVEPIVAESSQPFINWSMWDDGWTIHTDDYGWSAQFEHTVLVTEDGYEILTE